MVFSMRHFLRALAVGLVLVACSDSGGSGGGGGGGSSNHGGAGNGTHPGSCMNGGTACSAHQFCCADYAGNFTAAQVQNDCNIAGGQYSPDACTTENLEGSCTLYGGTAAEKTLRYYTGWDQVSHSDPVTACSAVHGHYEAPPP